MILGGHQNDGTGFSLSGRDLEMDQALEALYDSNKQGGLGPSSPNVSRWLGDIRDFFPNTVVQVMQKDALKRLNLTQMLFEKETPLTEPIKGSERYAAAFAAPGPKDHNGRSLRDLDMKTRMFKYPCSFLIYSEQFDALPQTAKDKLYRRLRERLTQQGRLDIIEILKDTKKDFPA